MSEGNAMNIDPSGLTIKPEEDHQLRIFPPGGGKLTVHSDGSISGDASLEEAARLLWHEATRLALITRAGGDSTAALMELRPSGLRLWHDGRVDAPTDDPFYAVLEKEFPGSISLCRDA